METRSNAEIDNAIERWHQGEGKGQRLHEYLGWTWEEYTRWVKTGKRP